MNKNDYRLAAYLDANKVDTEKQQETETSNFGNSKITGNSGKLGNSKNTEAQGNSGNPGKPLSDYMDRYGLVKVTKSTDKNSQEDSVFRRVAKFLVLLGVEEAAKVIPHLKQNQIDKIVLEIASIRYVDEDEATVILAEFAHLLEESRHSGGVDTAKDILVKAFGPEKAQQMIEKTVAFPHGKPFEYLQDMDTDRLLLLLKDESAPVRALVLSYLPAKKSASYINALNEEEKGQVVRRLALLGKMSPDIIRRIDSAMQEKLQTINTEKANSIDGRGTLANILKKMSSSGESSILNILQENDPELALDIKNRLFTIEDFINCDDKYLQQKLQTMSETDIAYIIAGKTDDFRGKILSNVSSGRGTLILDEEKFRKPMRKQDVDEKTNIFMSSLRKAVENGELVVLNKDDEIYV